jgi:hypothetical protein
MNNEPKVPNGYILVSIEDYNRYQKNAEVVRAFLAKPPKTFKVHEASYISRGWYVMAEDDEHPIDEIIKDLQAVISYVQNDNTLHPTTVQKVMATVKKWLNVV